LFKAYREDPDRFSLDYKRKAPPRKVDAKAEAGIIRELKKEARIIQDKSNPVKNYNYSYVREILETKHKISVSLPTIISRAKKMGFITRRDFGRAMIGRF
jgi:hypothetical protein